MDKIEATGENAQQIEFWNSKSAASWVEKNEEMDGMLRPLGAMAIERANLRPGEQILDIGCGCGATTLDMVNTVGSIGRVTGIDISAPMLELANHKIQQLPDSLRDVPSFTLADASLHEFSKTEYDLLFSRFGVMFFADPTAAFTNMRVALKPGGRLAFMCWGPISENDWVMKPMMAARAHLPDAAPTDPKAPGPFALSDREYVRDILTTAGFTDVAFEARTHLMRVGTGDTLEEATESCLGAGPVSRMLRDQPDTVKNQVKKSVASALAEHYKDGCVELIGKCWIVTAQNPAA
ncbi:MAG: methyltransferase domain-containing protein [Pseudomonadales bacterium]|nr:methyltransferase domain-containing protein [Pseudomonadales bacterium]